MRRERSKFRLYINNSGGITCGGNVGEYIGNTHGEERK